MSINQSYEDNELMQRFRSGDEKAFSEIYSHFVRPLRFFIGRFTKDEAIGEDIAAEAFIRTFRKHPDFQSIHQLKRYLYTAASTGAVDHFRSRQKEMKALENVSLTDQFTEDVELAYIRAEAVKAIHEAIDSLPTQSRLVIRMLFVEGKKLADIAEELQISYNTVQNHRQRGLELLRIRLNNDKRLPPSVLSFALSLL